MTTQIRGLAVRNNGKAVTFLASTDTDKASDGLIIERTAWDTSRFLKTGAPVIWAHDYSRPPIGHAENVRTTDAGLTMDVFFDEDSGDTFATMIAKKVRAGVIAACSVGFDIIEQVGRKVTKASLLELSIVPIGADPNAVAIARSAYTRSHASTKELEDTLQEAYVNRVIAMELVADIRKRSADLRQIEQRLGPDTCNRLIAKAAGKYPKSMTANWDASIFERKARA